MGIAKKCLPAGTLPYNSIKSTTTIMAKFFSDTPFIPVLPSVSKHDTLQNRIFKNIPGITFKNDKLVLKVAHQEFEDGLTKLNRAFQNPCMDNLEDFEYNAEFLEKYFQMIKKFKSPYAYINILGPFTVSQILMTAAHEQMLADQSYKKLFIQAVCVKALWTIEKIKQFCPDTIPVVILEEPMFGQFGTVAKNDYWMSANAVTDLFKKVTEKLKTAGAIVGVQCFEKCKWSIPIQAGVDLISYDAYNNPNNLSIIPELLIDFLNKGGIINWGIVPVISEQLVDGLTLNYLEERISATISGIVLAGVPKDLLYRNIMVSVNNDSGHLPVYFSEKAMILAIQLASRLAGRY